MVEHLDLRGVTKAQKLTSLTQFQSWCVAIEFGRFREFGRARRRSVRRQALDGCAQRSDPGQLRDLLASTGRGIELGGDSDGAKQKAEWARMLFACHALLHRDAVKDVNIAHDTVSRLRAYVPAPDAHATWKKLEELIRPDSTRPSVTGLTLRGRMGHDRGPATMSQLQLSRGIQLVNHCCMYA